MDLELEKKFLLDKLPDGLGEPVLIQQGYLYVDPFELRVRKMGPKCFLTYKSLGDEERVEWEREIPDWLYEKLVMKKVGYLIEKNRYRLERDGYIFEVDEYLGELAGSYIVEVEFDSREEYDSFQVPEWLNDAVDVTHDPRFKNRSLASKQV
jgi:CYTH domain-containing protein